MFMAIHPDKASAYSCGNEYDGYVCCNSYHAFGHDNYLTTINRTIIGTKYIKIDSGFNNSQTATINNVINSWNLQLACLSKEPTIENYIDDADIIIKGEVISIKYFECKGIPWSKLNVLVKKVISGNAILNQNIDIYVMEGYEYNNTGDKNLSAVFGDDLGLHNIGDTSIFVLTEEDGNNIFEKGSYRRTFGCFSEYRYIESENVYNIYDTKTGSKLVEKNLEATIDLYAE